MIIARCRSDKLPVTQDLENHGFFLTDTLVYYTYRLKQKAPVQESSIVKIRLSTSDGCGQIIEVAKRAFSGYFSHYHADRKLDKTQCYEVYQD